MQSTYTLRQALLSEESAYWRREQHSSPPSWVFVSAASILTSAFFLAVARYSGATETPLAFGLLASSFLALIGFFVSLFSDPLPRGRALRRALKRMRRLGELGVSAIDAVALTRLECTAGRNMGHCCSTCPEVPEYVKAFIQDEEMVRDIRATAASVFPGEAREAFSEAMRYFMAGMAESRIASCCVGHRFPGLDVPLQLLTGYDLLEHKSFVPKMVSKTLAGRFVTVGSWWENSPEAMAVSSLIRALADEDQAVLSAAESLADDWEQSPEDLIRVSRIVA